MLRKSRKSLLKWTRRVVCSMRAIIRAEQQEDWRDIAAPKVAQQFVERVLITAFGFASREIPVAAPLVTPFSPAILPGNGLAQHPFLYAGEWDTRKPDQSMFLVRDGRIVWSASILHKPKPGSYRT